MPEVSIWYTARAKGATVKATPAKAGDSLVGIIIAELNRSVFGRYHPDCHASNGDHRAGTDHVAGASDDEADGVDVHRANGPSERLFN